MASDTGWYYVKDGQTVGPVRRDELVGALPAAGGPKTARASLKQTHRAVLSTCTHSGPITRGWSFTASLSRPGRF